MLHPPLDNWNHTTLPALCKLFFFFVINTASLENFISKTAPLLQGTYREVQGKIKRGSS